MAKDIDQMAEEKYPLLTLDKQPDDGKRAFYNLNMTYAQVAYAECYRDHCLPVVEENKRLREALEKIIERTLSGVYDATDVAFIDEQAKSALSHVPKIKND